MNEEMSLRLAADAEGRELTIVASDCPHDICARYEPSVLSSCELYATGTDPEGGAEEWKRVFLDLRHALALMVQAGTMTIVFDDWGGVDRDAAKAAWDSLSEEERRIMPEAIEAAFEREVKALEAEARRHERLAEFARAQQQSEGEEITLKEAFARRAQGTERIRKIVEGEKA
jgi:hypothetical protein